MERHFTAWMTTVATCLDTPFVDVKVHEDQLTGDPDDDSGWSIDTTKDPELYVVTDVRADSDDDATPAVEAILAAHGWTTVGTWEACDTGGFVTVTRD